MEDARQKIRAFIKQYFVLSRVDQNLSDDDSLLARGVIDASGLQVLSAFLDKEFGVHVEESEYVAENLSSISRIAAFVSRKQSDAAIRNRRAS